MLIPVQTCHYRPESVADFGRNRCFILKDSGRNLPGIPVQTCHLTVKSPAGGHHAKQKEEYETDQENHRNESER
jgi:hypothetical protein